MPKMKELLLRYNYAYTGNCNCEGFPTEKYSNGDYQLRIRVKKELFKMKHLGRSVTQWIPTNQLEQTLNYHHNVAVQA